MLVVGIELLDRDRRRLKLLDDLSDALVDCEHARRQVSRFGFGANYARFAHNRSHRSDFEDAVAGEAQAGIDAEDAVWIPGIRLFNIHVKTQLDSRAKGFADFGSRHSPATLPA